MAKDGFSMSNREAVVTVAGDMTLTSADCGKVYVVNNGEASYVLTLPRPASAEAGWNIKCLSFVTSTTGSGATDNGYVPLAITGSGGAGTEEFIGGVQEVSASVGSIGSANFWAAATGSAFGGILMVSGNVGGVGKSLGEGLPDWLGGPGSNLTIACDGKNYLVRGTLYYSGSRHADETPFTP